MRPLVTIRLERPCNITFAPQAFFFLQPRPRAYLFARVTGLQHVGMTRRFDDDPILLLPADETVLHPWVGENLVHVGPLPRVEFEHAADDVAALAGQQTQQPQRTLDSGLFFRVVGLRGGWGYCVIVVVVTMLVMFLVRLVLSPATSRVS